jgi:hypothetical protein
MAENNITTTVSNEFTYSGVPIIIICILGVASNVLLLVAFIKDPLKCFRNSGTYLVMNLAVSDCLMSLLGPFVHTMIIPGPRWHKIFELLMVWFGMSSFLSIVSISIDRFSMVAYPIKHRVLMKGKVIVLWLVTMWIASCVPPALELFFFYSPQTNTINVYIIPVISVTISAVMYASTYRKLKKQSRNIALQNSNGSRAQEIRILKEKQFLQTIMIIACIAFVCVVPSMVFLQAYDALGFGREKNLASEILNEIFLSICYINFAVNPFIYVIRLPNYRKTFYLLYYKRGT